MAQTHVAKLLSSHFPWWAKIVTKLVLSRIPIRYRRRVKLGVFRHGEMESPDYVLSVFRKHFDRVDIRIKDGGFTALELGPGDSVASAIVARAFGAKASYLVDSGDFATNETSTYVHILSNLERCGFSVEELPLNATRASILEQFGGRYLTNGLLSLETIPDSSVDFVWSQAVLEHIRLAQFDEVLRNLHRVLKKDGICSHRVDFRDHLGGSLNNLRFSKRIWESEWAASSGFYTNRILFSEMINRFKRAGFKVEVVEIDRWESPPIARAKLATQFKPVTDHDLSIKGCDVILKPLMK